MNIRFPDSPDALPQTVRSLPGRFRQASPQARLVLGIVAALLLALIVWKAGTAILGLMSGPPVRPAPPVLVATAQRQDMAVVERTIGTVVANATVQLSARVQGQLLSANFKEGDIVKAGQLLFQLDARPYQAAYSSAMATLTSAQARAARFQRLLAAHAVSPQEADDARAAYLQAAASVQTARLNLEYTQIRSPIDGKTGPILIQPGNQVMAGGGMSGTASAASTTLVVITQIQPVKISFSLPQADLPRIQERARAHGLFADIQAHGAGGMRLSTPVDFVGNAVDDKTGTIELRATFANADASLVPGQLVDIGVTLNAIRGAIVVPHEAVNLGPVSNYVYVVRDGKAQMRPIKVLYDNGVKSAVQGELKAGETVVTDGQLRVVPGQPVQIAKPNAGAAGHKPPAP